MPPPASLRCFCTAVLLLLVTRSGPPAESSSSSSVSPGDLPPPYGSILSPLLRALSEHGGSRWSPGQRRRMKPEHRYMKYLTEVYKKSSRVQRSLDGRKTYNTVRLIKPRDEFLAQTEEGECGRLDPDDTKD